MLNFLLLFHDLVFPMSVGKLQFERRFPVFFTSNLFLTVLRKSYAFKIFKRQGSRVDNA